MPLNDDDRSEVSKLIQAALGVPEGKTLAEFLGADTEERINKTLNGYDKTQRKSREALEKQLTDIAAALKKKGEGDGDEDDADPGDTPPNPKGGKVSPEVQALIDQNKKLSKQFEASEKARQEEADKRAAMEAQAADRSRVDAVRNAAIAKGLDVDPEALDLLTAVVEHGKLVKPNDAGNGYLFQHGVDKITGEPEWHPLEAGLKQFVTTGAGARFRKPVKGGAPDVPAGGGGRAPSAGALSVEQIAAMSSGDLEMAIAEGRVQLE